MVMLVVCLLMGHCQSSQILHLNCWIQKACSVFGLVVLQCGEPQSQLDTSSRLGGHLSWEVKLGRPLAGLTVSLFLGYFCSQSSSVTNK